MWIPRSRWPPSAASTALGMAPMPSWSVAPSSTREAQWRPITRSASVSAGSGVSWIGSSTATAWSMWSMWISPSPWVRGMRGLIWAITCSAVWTAASEASTETPSEQKPWPSGGETWIRATSSGSTRRRKSAGTSLKKTGM